MSTERQKVWHFFPVDTLKSVEVLAYTHINRLATVATQVTLDALESLVRCHVADHSTSSCFVLRHVGRGIGWPVRYSIYYYIGSILQPFELPIDTAPVVMKTSSGNLFGMPPGVIGTFT
jgi:hypothetical protein